MCAQTSDDVVETKGTPLGVSRVATFIVAPPLVTFVRQCQELEGPVLPHSSSSTNVLLQERGTSHPAKKRKCSSRPPKESPPPVQIKNSVVCVRSDARKKLFFDSSFILPIPLVTCRVCQLARQHIALYRQEHPRPRRQQGRDEGAE